MYYCLRFRTQIDIWSQFAHKSERIDFQKHIEMTSRPVSRGSTLTALPALISAYAASNLMRVRVRVRVRVSV